MKQIKCYFFKGIGWKLDPLLLNSSNNGFAEPDDLVKGEILPTSWHNWAEAYYDNPLQLLYSDLDPQTTYKVRVVYSGENFANTKIKMVADSVYVIHPYMPKPHPIVPLEFPIPQQATKDGKLLLEFYPLPGSGGNGRGVQVAEIWLEPVD